MEFVTAIREAISKLYGVEVADDSIQLQPTRKEFEGDTTLVVFPFLRISKKAPEKTAEEIGEFIQKKLTIVTSYNCVKGFLNVSFSDDYWLSQAKELADTHWSEKIKKTQTTYMVEYSSPNTNKPLHLGHLRNIFLGDAVVSILKKVHSNVQRTQIINDRGIHICKSMLAWKQMGNGETPDSSQIKGDHLVGKYYVAFDKKYKSQISELVASGVEEAEAKKKAPVLLEAQNMLKKWESGDEEVVALWKEMNSWVYKGFESTYNRMGVNFDVLYYESDTYLLGKEVVLEGLEKGAFYKKEDGSVWCDLSDQKMDDKLLLRADGTSVYMTQDIGTAIQRFRDFPELAGIIYTVGNEQNHHFKVLFAILKKIGYSWAEGCQHLSYGMVELPTGKMKSREGTVVDADDLMQNVIAEAKKMTLERGHLEGMSKEEIKALYEMIGLGGLKYYLLRIDPKKGMMFDPEASIDLNGNTAPFLQYAYARIQSLRRKYERKDLSWSIENVQIESKEKDIIKQLNNFGEIVLDSAKQLSPSIVTNYLYDLTKSFNTYYQSTPILQNEQKEMIHFRLAISLQVASVIKDGLEMLGINVPNKM